MEGQPRLVTMPDGKVVKNVPANVSDDQAIELYTNRAAAAVPPAPSQPPAVAGMSVGAPPDLVARQQQSDDLEAAPRFTPPPKSVPEQLMRGAGLGLRTMGKAATAVPAMIGDLGVAPFNLAGSLLNKYLGTEVPRFTTGSEAYEMGADALGMPRPENAAERTAYNVGSAVTSVPGFIKGASQYGGRLLEPLTKNPISQYYGAGGASAAASAANELAPGNVPLQLGAGLVGGLIGGKGGVRFDDDLVTAPRLQAFNKANVRPSLADVSQSPSAQRARNVQAATPFSAGRVDRVERGRLQQVSEEADRISAGYGTALTNSEAGTVLKTSIKRFIDKIPVLSTIKKKLGSDDFKSAEDKALSRLTSEADAAYGEVRRKVPFFSSEKLDNLFKDNPMMSQALARAQVNAANTRKPDGTGSAFGLRRNNQGRFARAGIGQTNEGRLIELSFDAVDDIKQTFDEIIEGSVNQFGKINKEGRRAIMQKKQFLDAVEQSDTSGLYAKARAQYGHNAEIANSFKLGRQFLREDPDVIEEMVAGMGAMEREAWRTGVARAMRDKIQSTRDGRFEGDNSLFNNELNRSRIRAAFGNDKQFEEVMASVQRVDRTMKRVYNSETAESAYKKMETAARAEGGDIEMLEQMQKALSPDEMDTIAATFISRLGRMTAGAAKHDDAPDFSINNFTTRYQEMTKEAKNIIFGSNPELKAALENLAVVTRNMKRTEALANRSQSGNQAMAGATYTGGGAALASALAGSPDAALLTATGLATTLGGLRISAEAMYNPAFVRLMTKTISADPSRQQAAALAIVDFLEDNPELKSDGEELAKVLEPQPSGRARLDINTPRGGQ